MMQGFLTAEKGTRITCTDSSNPINNSVVKVVFCNVILYDIALQCTSQRTGFDSFDLLRAALYSIGLIVLIHINVNLKFREDHVLFTFIW